MEKITLKPIVKELLYKSNEPGVHFDVLSYVGTGSQEKNLGSIFVLSYLRQKEDDLAYLVSLISSLAKREFYSQQSVAEQNPKSAFERTLKKINEVLEDFFEKKDFALNLGLAIIAGSSIFISRLGKFKVALARNNEYIDILNNIDLFSKERGDEKQFSNIISGKLLPNDKIFAYFPIRAVSAREKLLNQIFTSLGQEEFSQKMAHLADNANNFACCGVHIDMKEIREIPVQVAKTPPILNLASDKNTDEMEPIPDNDRPKTEDQVLIQKQETAQTSASVSHAIRAEVSVAKRGNVLNSLSDSVKKALGFNIQTPARDIRAHGKTRAFLMISILVILPLAGLAFIKNRDSSEIKNAFSRADENLKLAQLKLSQNDVKNARDLLQAAISELSPWQDGKNKEAGELRNDINQILNSIDKVSDKEPELFFNANGNDLGFKLTVSGPDSVFAIDENNKIFSITDRPNELGQYKNPSKFIFAGSIGVSSINGSDVLEIFDAKSKKNLSVILREAVSFSDSAVYENNLYTLAENSIYKYADALIGQDKRENWLANYQDGRFLSLAVDGNVYILTEEGKIIKFFRGKKESEFTISITPSAGSRIYTDKESSLIYLIDKAAKKVFVFDKAAGELKVSYRLDVVGNVQDANISKNGTITVLSENDNIWQIKQ